MQPHKTNSRRAWGAYSVYLLLEAVSALAFQIVATLYIVFYDQAAGLDVFQIVLMGTVFETTIFLFEVPTGIVADMYSRRLSVIIGFALSGIALALAGLFPSFTVILLAEIIAGVGVTFTSGALEAWISDEIGPARANQAFIRSAQLKTTMRIIGIAVSVLLAHIALQLTFIVGGVLLAGLAALLTAIMSEDGFRPATQQTSWRAMWGTLGRGLQMARARRALWPILLVALIYGFHGEGFDHLWQKHFLDNIIFPAVVALDPIVWFGALTFAVELISILLNEWVRRRVPLNDPNATTLFLLYAYGVMIVGIVTFSLALDFGLAAAAYILVMGARAASEPLSKAWLNGHTEPSIRATMFSLFSQINSIGEIIGGPPIGALGRAVSLRAALLSSGLALALTLPILLSALNPSPSSITE